MTLPQFVAHRATGADGDLSKAPQRHNNTAFFRSPEALGQAATRINGIDQGTFLNLQKPAATNV